MFTLIILLVFLLTWVHHGNDFLLFGTPLFCLLYSKQMHFASYGYWNFNCFRLHGVGNENPLAPLIGKLGLPLYRTSGDNSVLYDHDLERFVFYVVVTYHVSSF